MISSVVKQRCLTALIQIGRPAGAKAHGKEGWGGGGAEITEKNKLTVNS